MPLKRAEKTPMPERDSALRAHDFIEVNEGYNFARAEFEAECCLRCQDPVCIEGCPVTIPIPDFIHAIAAGDMPGAATILRSANPLPAICGRVCPQETQCEALCHLGTCFGPVAIGYLERFVADWERDQPAGKAPAPPARPERVAVIGSGPAGLVCAGELARLRHPVTVFEGLHAAGGVLDTPLADGFDLTLGLTSRRRKKISPNARAVPIDQSSFSFRDMGRAGAARPQDTEAQNLS